MVEQSCLMVERRCRSETVILPLLVAEHGVHEDKYRSFEQFRSSFEGIEIFTFDELYERSRFIATTSV